MLRWDIENFEIPHPRISGLIEYTSSIPQLSVALVMSGTFWLCQRNQNLENRLCQRNRNLSIGCASATKSLRIGCASAMETLRFGCVSATKSLRIGCVSATEALGIDHFKSRWFIRSYTNYVWRWSHFQAIHWLWTGKSKVPWSLFRRAFTYVVVMGNLKK